MNPGGSVESLCLLHLGDDTMPLPPAFVTHQPLFVSKIWPKPATVRLLVWGLGPQWRRKEGQKQWYLHHAHLHVV